MDAHSGGRRVAEATQLGASAGSAPGSEGSGVAARTQLRSAGTSSGDLGTPSPAAARTQLGGVGASSGGGTRTQLGTVRPASASRLEGGAVDLVGTIRTNGLGGAVEYRWLRSDGETTAPMTQAVDAGQSIVQVHLLWTLAGRGRYPATATLQILHPQPVTATGGFTYSCR